MKTICDERTFEVEFKSCGKACVTIRKDYSQKVWTGRIWIIKGDAVTIKMENVIFTEDNYSFDTTSSDDIVLTVKLILKAFD